jgi:hypothetical protein
MCRTCKFDNLDLVSRLFLHLSERCRQRILFALHLTLRESCLPAVTTATNERDLSLVRPLTFENASCRVMGVESPPLSHYVLLF